MLVKKGLSQATIPSEKDLDAEFTRAATSRAKSTGSADQKRQRARTLARQQHAAERIAAASSELNVDVAEASAATEELSKAMQQISAGAEEAASASEESAAAMTQVNRRVKLQSEVALSALDVTRKLQVLLDQTNHGVAQLVSNVGQASSRQEASVELTQELENQAQGVIEAVNQVIRIAADPLHDMAHALLDSQERVLENLSDGPQQAGGLAATFEVLSRLARHLSCPDIEADLAQAQQQGLSQADLHGALVALQAELGPKSAPASNAPTAAAATPRAARAAEPAYEGAGDAPTRKSSVLRVDADRIDALMNLTGELIVAKNAMAFLARKAEEIEGTRELLREIKAQHDAINRITEELQTAIMQIRMVPVGSVLGRFNRLVRDLSRKLGKKIELQTEGEETEADKAVVEELSEPLVHLIRNAIDHGLELPEDRKAVGKTETGLILLEASQRDDSVVIEIRDDGRGIDVERVTAKALERGVIDEEGLSRLSRDGELQLILTPGLSTKEEISDLSGRGVGMDVVASMVRRLGGSVSLSSEPGQGTTVRIALPLSMAVQRLMIIEVEDGLYGVPIESVIESQKIPTIRIRRHREGEMILLRDRLIPLLRLRRLFACREEVESDTISVMIVDVEGAEIGLVVDRFHAGVDAIVKPMSCLLSQTNCYSGTALLGDGSVLLALDLPEVVECQFHPTTNRPR